MTKRLSPERIANYKKLVSVRREFPFQPPHVDQLEELLGHIDAIEAEKAYAEISLDNALQKLSKLQSETHGHIDTKIDLEHANDVCSVLEKELAEAKAEIARLKEARERELAAVRRIVAE